MSNASVPELHKERETRSKINEQLMLNYEILMNEQKRVDLLIREYEMLEDVNKNSSISVNQKYSAYITITLILGILVILFILFYVV